MVSVVLNTYNRIDELKVAIHSVLKQKDIKIELIIINDYPNELLTLKKLELTDYLGIITIINNSENYGLPYSRTLGVLISKYNKIAFLDDDDYWIDSFKLKKQIELIDKTEAKHFICFSNIIESSTNEEKNCNTPNRINKFWRRNGFIYPSTTIISKNTMFKAGLFDNRFKRGIDSDLYRRIIFILKGELIHLNEATTFYKVLGEDSITSANKTKTQLKNYIYSNALVLRKYKTYLIYKPFSLIYRLKLIIKAYLKLLING